VTDLLEFTSLKHDPKPSEYEYEDSRLRSSYSRPSVDTEDPTDSLVLTLGFLLY